MGRWLGSFCWKECAKGQKRKWKVSLSLSSGLLLAAVTEKKKKILMVFWHENIGKLDIIKSKGIERHSFSPCTSEWYNDSKFLPFYSFIAIGDIQRFHRRWVKAIQSVCLPLIFPLMYSSAPIVPPLRVAVTHTSLLLSPRGRYLQPLRGWVGADLFIIWQTTLSQAIPLAISISMTKYFFYVSGFQTHRCKCCAGPLFWQWNS